MPQQSQGHRLGCDCLCGFRHDLCCGQDLPVWPGIPQSCWYLWLLCRGENLLEFIFFLNPFEGECRNGNIHDPGSPGDEREEFV